ncbi:MAG: hypothetical protein ACTSUO_06600 [Candidatus Thorarchaeota archaeon]
MMKSRVSQKGTIESVDRTGNAATVKLVWVSERDENVQEYTDYILLLIQEVSGKLWLKYSIFGRSPESN